MRAKKEEKRKRGEEEEKGRHRIVKKKKVEGSFLPTRKKTIKKAFFSPTVELFQSSLLLLWSWSFSSSDFFFFFSFSSVYSAAFCLKCWPTKNEGKRPEREGVVSWTLLIEEEEETTILGRVSVHNLAFFSRPKLNFQFVILKKRKIFFSLLFKGHIYFLAWSWPTSSFVLWKNIPKTKFEVRLCNTKCFAALARQVTKNRGRRRKKGWQERGNKAARKTAIVRSGANQGRNEQRKTRKVTRPKKVWAKCQLAAIKPEKASLQRPKLKVVVTKWRRYLKWIKKGQS